MIKYLWNIPLKFASCIGLDCCLRDFKPKSRLEGLDIGATLG